MAPVKPITLRVYTCDNDHFESIEFETGRHTTAADVSLAMMSRLNISPDLKDVFSIWLLSPYLQLQLKSYHVPVKLFKKWREFLSQYTAASYDVCVSDLPILSFRRNAFLSLREEKRLLTKRDSRKALNLLYHEALHHVISGRYPLQREELVELASIQCAIEHKQFDEETHTANFFKDKLKLYFPAHLTSNTTRRRSIFFGGKNKFNNLEQDLSDGYKDICKKCNESSSNRLAKTVDVETSAIACSLGKDEEIKLWQDTDLQLKLLYLQRCWNKPYYGCVMFRGQVERKTLNLLTYSDRNIIVAINPECIHLFTDENKREILLYLTYDLFSWDFQPATEEGEKFFSSLWLEFDSTHGSQRVAKRLQIFSRQAPMMDAMISRCVDELNKHDEEMKKLRGGSQDAPSHSITTGISVTSTKNFKEDKLKCDIYKADDIQ
jgi:hypothetical protein